MAHIGFVKINQYTEGHPDILRKLGYDVDAPKDKSRTVNRKNFSGIEKFIAVDVKCDGFLRELDLTGDSKKAIREVIKNRQLLTYKTKVKTSEGVLFGIPACKFLNNITSGLSALMVNPVENESKTDSSALDEFLKD